MKKAGLMAYEIFLLCKLPVSVYHNDFAKVKSMIPRRVHMHNPFLNHSGTAVYQRNSPTTRTQFRPDNTKVRITSSITYLNTPYPLSSLLMPKIVKCA